MFQQQLASEAPLTLCGKVNQHDTFSTIIFQNSSLDEFIFIFFIIFLKSGIFHKYFTYTLRRYHAVLTES